MTRSKQFATITFLLLSLALTACKKDEQSQISDANEKLDPLAMETELNILALDGRIESGITNPAFDWVTPFETATGCKLNTVLLETNDLLASSISNKRLDLVIAADSFLPSDSFQKIDFSRLRSFKELDKRFTTSPSIQNKLALPLHWKLLKPVAPATESILELESTHLMAKAQNPNCAYAWMEWTLSPKVQADIAAALDTIPVVPAACIGNELLGDDACERRMMELPVEHKAVAP